VSTYQYYEFLALDRPLTPEQQAEVRKTSTRAHIDATRFVNEYHYSDYGGSAERLLTRYYDAHLYFANWGSRQVMLKLPKKLLDMDTVEQYWADIGCAITASGSTVVFDFSRSFDDDEWDDVWEASAIGTSLGVIAGIRTEIVAGDLRGLYLAWLAAYGRWEVDEEAFPPEDEDRLEPPLPAGLATPSAAQRALSDFLRLDQDLFAAAAQASPVRASDGDQSIDFDQALAGLSGRDKDRLLRRVFEGDGEAVRMELRGRARPSEVQSITDANQRRTVGELLDAAAVHREQRLNRERLAAAAAAEAPAADEAKRERIERDRRLRAVARDPEGTWDRIEELVAAMKPREYDEAADLVEDLWALARRDGTEDSFTPLVQMLRARHARKPAFQRRLDERGLPAVA
jgi:hypothetical protein